MAEISIGNNHREQIARWQHTLQWLGAERERLAAEHAYTSVAITRVQTDLLGFVQSAYALAPGLTITIDADRGVIIVPDPPAESLVARDAGEEHPTDTDAGRVSTAPPASPSRPRRRRPGQPS